MIGLVAYSAIRLFAAASVAPFWYDEILTRTIVAQTSLADAMRALLDGADSHTPVFYLMEFCSLRLFRCEELALRFPSVIAFEVTLISIFLYSRRRWTEFEALACAAVLVATAAFQQYAAEARAYSILLACISWALVCYDRMPSRIWTIALALTFFGAGAIHYYALLSVVPFALAELGHTWSQRVFRWEAWAAMACVLVPLAITWRFLARLRSLYGATFWAQLAPESLPAAYGELLCIGAVSGSIVSLILLVVQSRQILLALRGREPFQDTSGGVLRAGLLLLPIVGYLAAAFLHGPLVPRYVIATILGVALTAGSFRVGPGSAKIIVFSFLAFHAAIGEAFFWNSLHLRLAARPTASAEGLIQSAGHLDLRVVVAHGLLFLPLQKYGSPQLQTRLVYLVDARKAVEYSGTDSVDKNLAVLRRYAPISAIDFDEFRNKHSEFLVFTRKVYPDLDWLSPYLARTARSRSLVAESPDGKVYLVQM